MVRVLHSVKEYLNLSENWIYPQIVQVPGVQGRVVCNSVVNAAAFPVGTRGMIVHPPPSSSAFGLRRLMFRIGRRLRMEGGLCRSRMRLWRPDALHAHFGPKDSNASRGSGRWESPSSPPSTDTMHGCYLEANLPGRRATRNCLPKATHFLLKAPPCGRD